jgi:hypothetical protein
VKDENKDEIFVNTEKPRFNESEWTKDLVLYSRGFVIAGAFKYEIDYGGTLNQVLYCRNFAIEGVVITRFQCMFQSLCFNIQY